MTLQQEAYNKIDQLSDDNVRFVIQLITLQRIRSIMILFMFWMPWMHTG